MPGILDQIQQQATRDANADVAQAAKDATWANQFNSIKPVDKLRADLNVTTAINRALDLKHQLTTKDKIENLKLKAATAKFEQDQQLFPLQEKLLQARVDATGAAERRKALEETTRAEQTSRINTGMLKLYQSGAQAGTPEFQSQAVELLASNPLGDIKDIEDLGKLAGFSSELTPDKYVAEAVRLKKAAAEAGLSNPKIGSFSGRPTVVEGAAVVTPEQSIDNAVRRKVALQAVDPPKTEKPPKKETFKEWTEELAAAVSAYGGKEKVPKDVWDAFEKRKAAITAAPAAPAPSQPAAPAASPTAPAKIASAADFAALPSGTEFIDPQGVKRRKP